MPQVAFSHTSTPKQPTTTKKMKAVSAVSASSGNTKPRKRSRVWTFTHFDYTVSGSDIHKKLLSLGSTKHLFQDEIAPTTNKRHRQGTVRFKNQVSFSTLKDEFPTIHIEPCRSEDDSFRYCKKSETKDPSGETICHGFPVLVRDPIVNPLPWQDHILTTIIKCSPDPRMVYWFWEPLGNMGKTALSKHICLNYKAIVLGGKAHDIKAGVSSYIKEHQELHCVIFDLGRSEKISYEAIESVKNGIFFSGKYESSMCMFNPPHVIVFANIAPTLTKLSEDRWKVRNLLDFPWQDSVKSNELCPSGLPPAGASQL